MLICPVCSQTNPESAVYCLRCGSELPRRTGTVPQKPLETAVEAPPPPSMLAGGVRIGEVVDGKYLIESVLGEGGMGIVYLARDINTDTLVVVKAIRSEMAHDPDLRERIRAEGRALARIDHPNVVRLNAVVIERDRLFLVMQYVEGQSLDKIIAEHVSRRAPLAFDEAMRLFRQIVAGVGAAHREGVVHRDIKPGNVLVRAKDGVAKVTDFGIAKQEEDAKAGRGKTQGIIGSLWYMAPEQVLGRRDLDKRVDIYALGIVLFEMLMGQVPFDSPSDVAVMKMHVEAPLPSVSGARSDVPPELDAFLGRACAKQREDRFSSADELLFALDAMLAPRPAPHLPNPTALSPQAQAEPPLSRVSLPPRSVVAHPAVEPELPPPPPPPPHRSRAPLFIALAVALGGAAAAAAFFVTRDGGPETPRPTAQPTSPQTAGSARDASAPSPPDAAPAPGSLAALAALEGKWMSDSGKHYDAVMSSGQLEFRVRDPAEFPGQNYSAGEPRFTLLPIENKAYFGVEDKIRPIPPANTSYEPGSKGTCQAVWSDVNGKPLEARYGGGRLSVDLAKITPSASVFDAKGGKITGCRGLRGVTAEKIESTLGRE